MERAELLICLWNLIELTDKHLRLTGPEASSASGEPPKPTGKILGGQGFPSKENQQEKRKQVTPASEAPE